MIFLELLDAHLLGQNLFEIKMFGVRHTSRADGLAHGADQVHSARAAEQVVAQVELLEQRQGLQSLAQRPHLDVRQPNAAQL